MEKRIILITHSAMAAGMKKTLEFIAGDSGVVDAIQAYTVDQDPEVRLQELLEQYREDKVIILTDVFFGSVNQMCVPYINRGVFLMTGVNLPLVLELLDVEPEQINQACLEELVQKARDGLQLMNTVMQDTPEQEQGEFL